MNDSEIDRHIAASFQVPDAGSDALSARLKTLQADRRINNPLRTKQGMRVVSAGRLVVGLAVTAALVLGLLVYPRMNRPVSAAAAVRKALARINSWHLKGWKMQDGRKVEWEVWGRRSPFFYREQVGANVVLDDGAQRLCIYGPSTESYRLKGVCLRLPTLQGAENVPWSYDRMVLQWRNAGKPFKQTLQGTVFNFNASNMDGYHINTDNLYHIDGSTALPTRYEKRTCDIDHGRTYTTVALLDADYDTPVPVTASRIVAPPGYREFDALATTKGLPTQDEGAASADGLTIQCQPVSVDREGNVLMKMRGWLANSSIPAGQGDVHFQAAPVVQLSTAPLDPAVTHDDLGRAYAAVQWDALGWNADRSTILMLFVPREPLAAGAALPRALTSEFDASAVAGWGAPGNTIIHHDMALTVSLPSAGPPIMQATAPYARPDGRPRSNLFISYGGFDNLETAIYLARAREYGRHSDTRVINTAVTNRLCYWSERAIATANNLRVQFYRENLARTYQGVGNKEHARRLLRDMLAEKRFTKLQCQPFDRSPAGYRKANEELHEWNQQYYREARTMLAELDKVRQTP